MPIRVTCACGKAFHFKDEFAGRRAKCPACGRLVQIPSQRASGSAHAPEKPAPPLASLAHLVSQDLNIQAATPQQGLDSTRGKTATLKQDGTAPSGNAKQTPSGSPAAKAFGACIGLFGFLGFVAGGIGGWYEWSQSKGQFPILFIPGLAIVMAILCAVPGAIIGAVAALVVKLTSLFRHRTIPEEQNKTLLYVGLVASALIICVGIGFALYLLVFRTPTQLSTNKTPTATSVAPAAQPATARPSEVKPSTLVADAPVKPESAPARLAAAPVKPAAAPATEPAKELTLDLGGGITMKMVLIFAGKFQMGSPSMQTSGPLLGPLHEVTISKPFYVGVTEVTQAQYEAVMGMNPSHFKGATNPVEMVSWSDATEFCKKLSEKTRQAVRLPTEAEWEYACRAGSKTAFSFGDADAGSVDYAWYDGNSGGTTHPVGQKKPNAWGLYDMHGNVFEWCADWYGDYPKGAVTDPQGPASGPYLVFRGGAWGIDLGFGRSELRLGGISGYRNSNVGFRVVVSVSAPGL